MANRLLLILYLIGICVGGLVAVWGLAIFVDIRPGGTPIGATGILVGICTIATGCAYLWSRKRGF